jgi:hypothetical protein
MCRIGVLVSGAEADQEVEARLAGFLKGLEELGWLRGRNVRIDYRFAAGIADRHRAFAKELRLSASNSRPISFTMWVGTMRRATTRRSIALLKLLAERWRRVKMIWLTTPSSSILVISSTKSSKASPCDRKKRLARLLGKRRIGIVLSEPIGVGQTLGNAPRSALLAAVVEIMARIRRFGLCFACATGECGSSDGEHDPEQNKSAALAHLCSVDLGPSTVRGAAL